MSKHDRDTTRQRRLLAEQIVKRLFTNGAKQVAERLILSKDGRDLGGWSFGPAVDQVDAVLREVADVEC